MVLSVLTKLPNKAKLSHVCRYIFHMLNLLIENVLSQQSTSLAFRPCWVCQYANIKVSQLESPCLRISLLFIAENFQSQLYLSASCYKPVSGVKKCVHVRGQLLWNSLIRCPKSPHFQHSLIGCPPSYRDRWLLWSPSSSATLDFHVMDKDKSRFPQFI